LTAWYIRRACEEKRELEALQARGRLVLNIGYKRRRQLTGKTADVTIRQTARTSG